MSLTELLGLLPVLILVGASTALLMAGAWWPNYRRLLQVGIGAALLAALVAVSYTPPLPEVGNLYATSLLPRLFTALWSLTAAAVLLLSLRYGVSRRFDGGVYSSLVLFAAAGMALLSSSSSLFGLFLGLEAYTLVLYILIAFDRTCPQGAEAGLKYLVPGAIATGLLAFGISLIYVAAGSLHLPEAATASLAAGTLRPVALLGWLLLMGAVGFKISLVPFHLWTPDVYQGAPLPITTLLATGSKGAVLAGALPLFAALGPARVEQSELLWLLAAATMLVGTLCALPQQNIKRLLAYSSMVHMGYLLTGLIAGNPAGDASVAFYLVVYTVASIGAFGLLISMSDAAGERQDLSTLTGVAWRHPVRATLLGLFLLSLAGLPPTAGFIGKFGLFLAAIDAGYTGLALVAILASLVSVAYYIRVVMVMFARSDDSPTLPATVASEGIVIALCVAGVLLLGLYPGPLLDLLQPLF
jgi:NADH-quinone oxidoreductase subunit N